MSAAEKLHWSSASATHVGRVRTLNEDACLELENQALWAVADGMGGHAAGDYASNMIVDSLAGIQAPTSLGAFVEDVSACLQDVNTRLCAEAGRRRESIIGSTLVLLMAFDSHCVSMWAGDSRAYLYRDGKLRQLTRDHSHIEDLIDRGKITRDQAAHHPGGNVITRAVGVSDNLMLDSAMYEVKDGDTFLLCSDGLYNEVTDEQIRQALGIASSHEACNALIEHALAHGARDNISVVVIHAEAEGQITRTRLNPVRRNAPSGDEGPDDPTTLR